MGVRSSLAGWARQSEPFSITPPPATAGAAVGGDEDGGGGAEGWMVTAGRVRGRQWRASSLAVVGSGGDRTQSRAPTAEAQPLGGTRLEAEARRGRRRAPRMTKRKPACGVAPPAWGRRRGVSREDFANRLRRSLSPSRSRPPCCRHASRDSRATRLRLAKPTTRCRRRRHRVDRCRRHPPASRADRAAVVGSTSGLSSLGSTFAADRSNNDDALGLGSTTTRQKPTRREVNMGAGSTPPPLPPRSPAARDTTF